MKFFQTLALIGTAAAVRLTQQPATPIAHQPSHLMKVQWEDLTEEQMKEIEEWFVEQLTTGEKTITW